MLKVVIDANVFIGALLTPGSSTTVVKTYMEYGLVEAFYPEQLIKDLRRAPTKRKLEGRILPTDINKLLALLERKATFVALTNVPAVCRDPDDDPYLACAVVANCSYIISGDGDLLDLDRHGKTVIVSPSQFLQIFNERI